MWSLLCLFVALDVSAIRFENGNWVQDVPAPGHCIPVTFKPRREKTGFLLLRKQRRRSASR